MLPERDTIGLGLVDLEDSTLKRDYPCPIPKHLLDKPVAFHRCYAAIAGSATAGLMLAQAIYWTPREPRGDGWFYKTRDEWHKETFLTRSEQETARKRLKARGLMKEHLRGLPAQLWFKVNMEKVIEGLTEYDGS